MKAVLPALARPLLEAGLPPELEVAWFASPAEAKAGIADADIAWVDMQPTALVADAIHASGPRLKWVSTIYAGLDAFPLDRLRARGVTVTNGAGINAYAVAEYAVLGVLAAAKRFDAVVRAHDRHEWPKDAPGKIELFETRALVIGYGAIGRLIGERLAAFGVAVTGVTRSGRDGTITADRWRAQLGQFDWVVLAAPSTDDTKALIGADELAAMKPGAWLINIARGDMIDDAALLAALHGGRIGGAFLDPTNPEPLPPEHPLWSAPNCMITMHLSGRSQTKMFRRAAALFLDNLSAFRAGRPMRNVADLDAGY
jgi:phosphoglycerate dehydrogenase-like enzyme